MKTTTGLMNTMKRAMLGMLVLGAVACGDSAAFYAVQDEPGAMMGEEDGGQKGGKGDMPGTPTTPTTPVAPSEDVALSTALLEFEGLGYEAFIALESQAAVVDAFGPGAVVCSHDARMAGRDDQLGGRDTKIYARRRDNLGVGMWQELELEVAEGGSFRARTMLYETTQVDLYVAEPDAVDFMLIEPLAPM